MSARPLILVFSILLLTACNDDTPMAEDVGSDLLDMGEDETLAPVVPIGIACTDSDACNGGLCATLLPNGMCTLSCDTQDCPNTAVCREINGFPFCLPACTSSGACRGDEGYACIEGACDLGCRNVFDCDEGEVCAEGVCIQASERKPLGSSCQEKADCLSSLCLSLADGGLCTETCGATSGCAAGWTCEALTPVGGSAAVELCRPPAPASSDSVVLEAEPDSNTYTFEVGEDVVAFLIVGEGDNPQATVALQNLRSPTGEVVAGVPRNGFTSPMRFFSNRGHGSAMVPNTDDPTLQPIPGTWSFEFLVSPGDAVKRVEVFFTRRQNNGAEPAATAFDLNIFVPDGALQGFTHETAQDSNLLNGALTHVEREYWNEHGVTLGERRYFPLPEDYLRIDTDAEIYDMLTAESVRAPEGALNIFLVREHYSTSVQGLSAGIPGAVGQNGNAGAGVMIVVQPTVKSMGDNLTHELGHFLGLYHVTEQAGSFHDVISDTPECLEPPSLIPIGDASGCWKNIMYPLLLGDIAPQSFSEAQGRILRLNPRGYRP